jgi:hypothetical protein
MRQVDINHRRQKRLTLQLNNYLLFPGGIPGCPGLFRRRRRYASLPCLRHPSAPPIPAASEGRLHWQRSLHHQVGDPTIFAVLSDPAAPEHTGQMGNLALDNFQPNGYF